MTVLQRNWKDDTVVEEKEMVKGKDGYIMDRDGDDTCNQSDVLCQCLNFRFLYAACGHD